MAEILIDATRIVGRLLKGRLATGIDRVCLAYAARYAPVARAVLQRGRFGMILSKSASRELFSMILEPERGLARRAALLIAKSVLLPSREPVRPSSLLYRNGMHADVASGFSDFRPPRKRMSGGTYCLKYLPGPNHSKRQPPSGS